MIECVWTVDHHPTLCGTAKWSHALARHLGVPVVPWGTPGKYPLVSVRASEVEAWGDPPAAFDLFLHDWFSWDGRALDWLRGATRVYAANVDIGRALRAYRPDVEDLFCPSPVEGDPTRGAINVLTFGMAHKIQVDKYEKLSALLDATGVNYTVSLSTAIHEGSPWDETALAAERLRAVFGSRLRVLGYLADDALAKALQECTAVAIFYEPALRANNTSFWTAAAAWRPIITNLDADSPSVIGAYDIDRITTVWDQRMVPARIPDAMTWTTLIHALAVPVHA